MLYSDTGISSLRTHTNPPRPVKLRFYVRQISAQIILITGLCAAQTARMPEKKIKKVYKWSHIEEQLLRSIKWFDSVVAIFSIVLYIDYIKHTPFHTHLYVEKKGVIYGVCLKSIRLPFITPCWHNFFGIL